jgi:hypothetical protein
MKCEVCSGLNFNYVRNTKTDLTVLECDTCLRQYYVSEKLTLELIHVDEQFKSQTVKNVS